MRQLRADALALALLLALWLLFFWRLLTPITADQASFKQGDFSGQFVAFGGYQSARLTAGEIPLWNPYNNGGFPFIADPQAAVFYPPRWLTIALSHSSGGWSYASLQMEAIAHVLLLSLWMYLFVRRLTQGTPGSVFGAWVAAVVVSYGGFTTGYPPLQLALLEAAIWLPLAALGILEATRPPRPAWRWLALTGFSLGLSWLAGHPQTSFFLTWLLLAWYGWRCAALPGGRLWHFIRGSLLFGLLAGGTTAVTLLPGLEYLRLTARADLGFTAKGNGFPLQDVAQVLFPGVLSLFSPLYAGLPALLFAGLALWRQRPAAGFWGIALLVALLHSFGANSAFFHAAYHLVPGLRFFRGQERAAFIVAYSLAILAGTGAARVAGGLAGPDLHRLRQATAGLLAGMVGLGALLFVARLYRPEAFGPALDSATLGAAVLGTCLLLFTLHDRLSRRALVGLFGLLIVFELFTVTQDSPDTYDPRPAAAQVSSTPPPLLEPVLRDADGPFRVDGFRGVQANYGSLYGIMDMRGISPLFLTAAQTLIDRDYSHNPLAWELFAVKYVFSERESFSTPTQIIARGADRDGPVNLHRLTNPRPPALLLYRADVVDSDAFARALLDDPRYDPRAAIILQGDPGLALPAAPPPGARATISTYLPEQITVQISTPENAILSLAQVDYPGWQATLDGVPVPILRAYSTLMAVPIPAGEHTLRLVYDPLSYRLGAGLSLVTWAGLVILALFTLGRAVVRRWAANRL
ncbi:MAG: YfhO family protein [Anaerolineae bacterium]|nr:YfhO family protein [Anaerolineae bacterium]